MLVKVILKSTKEPQGKLVRYYKLGAPEISQIVSTRYRGIALKNQLALLNMGIDLLFTSYTSDRCPISVRLTIVDDERPIISLAA